MIGFGTLLILRSTHLRFFSAVLMKAWHRTPSNLNYALSISSPFATTSYLKNTSQSGREVEEVRNEGRLQQEERKMLKVTIFSRSVHLQYQN